MYQLRLLILSILLIFFSDSCAGPQTPGPPSPSPDAPLDQSDEIKRQTEIISRLTDQVLVALATYNYSKLEQLINSSELEISGAAAAVRLIGERAPTMVLGPWDAQKIEVSFDDQILQAVAKVNVTYRYALNRRPQTALFTFRFHRTSRRDDWRLLIK